MPCDVAAIDSAVLTPSLPGPDDLVWFILPDGSVVFRKWSTISGNGGAALPDDARIEVTASGGTLNNGQSTFTLTQFAGFRVRLYRTYIKQDSVSNPSGYYYNYTIGTGGFTVFPALTTGEIIQVEAY